MTLRRALALGSIVAASVAAPRDASAYCRTTTDQTFTPSLTQPCDPNGVPLAWGTKCAGYVVNQQASVQITFDQARTSSQTAFDHWSAPDCPTDTVACTGSGGGNPSMKVSFKGPTTTHKAEYKGDGNDENVIVFWDSGWPHPDGDVTLALTTVTFSTTSGEIYDSDIEVNSNPSINSLTVDDPTGRDVYDLLSIFQHETGHFLGLAHTQPEHVKAVMTPKYTRGDAFMRQLSPDDVCGVCNVYPPKRDVACEASQTLKGGCHCAIVGARSTHAIVGARSTSVEPRSAGALAMVMAVGATIRRRKRRR